MVDDFEIETIYDDRTYERYQLTFKVDGNEFKGELHNGKFEWVNPHPSQAFNEEKIQSIENEIDQMLSEHNIKDYSGKETIFKL